MRRLIAAQFPQWTDLPIRPVDADGWDNRTFHLGEYMSVRLPSAGAYSAQVTKEQKWLPKLGPLLPLPIPVPLAMGVPASDYPWHWSVYRWLEGESMAVARVTNPRQCALKLAQFLATLQRIDPAGGPPPGQHNFHRGGPPSVYDSETRCAISALRNQIDADAAAEVWDAALDATYEGTSVWVHGDVSAGNLLAKDGQLCAVIDFGCSGIGDPACDLTIAWTFLSGKSREAFRSALPLDAAAWARGRGWALWKALITLAEHIHSKPKEAEEARRVIDAVLADHERAD